MRFTKSLLTVVALSGLSSAAMAASPNWRFVEGGYTNADVGAGDFDGVDVGGVYLLENNIYVTGEHKMLDDNGTDLDMTTVGLGYRMPLDSSTDAYFGANFERVDLENYDENGYSVHAGLRSMVTEQVELLGQVGYYDVDTGDVTVKVGANYYFTPRWAVGASFEKIDDLDITQLNARYTF